MDYEEFADLGDDDDEDPLPMEILDGNDDILDDDDGTTRPDSGPVGATVLQVPTLRPKRARLAPEAAVDVRADLNNLINLAGTAIPFVYWDVNKNILEWHCFNGARATPVLCHLATRLVGHARNLPMGDDLDWFARLLAYVRIADRHKIHHDGILDELFMGPGEQEELVGRFHRAALFAAQNAPTLIVLGQEADGAGRGKPHLWVGTAQVRPIWHVAALLFAEAHWPAWDHGRMQSALADRPNLLEFWNAAHERFQRPQ